MAALKENWKGIQKKLSPLSKAEILRLIGDLYESNDNNRRFLSARLMKGEVSPKKYREQIHAALYPDWNSGDTGVRIADARKAISDFQKASKDSGGTIDLMIYFLEVGTNMIETFGMDYEQFYDSMESMFRRVVNRLRGKDKGLLSGTIKRLQKIEMASRDTGYGYGDSLAEMMDDLRQFQKNTFPSGTNNDEE